MNATIESYGRWLADYYLVASVLLGLALAGMAALKQPAQRLAIAKSTLVSLVLLAFLCALPGWSAIHLLTAKSPPPILETHEINPAPSETLLEQPRPAFASPVMPTAEVSSPPVIAGASGPAAEYRVLGPTVLVSGHLIGVVTIIGWLLLGWLAALRLRRTAIPAPPTAIDILNKLIATNDRPPRVQLLTHDRINVPVALGVWRSAIVLPARWINEVPLPFREGQGEGSPTSLHSVLAHESAHVLNHDLRWLALARFLFIALWANPLFWLTRRRLRLGQEALADAAAAQLTSRQRYAEQLVAWARDVHSRPALHFSSAVGLWEGPSQLRQRIAILLNERLIVLRNCSRRWRLVTAMASIATAVALSIVTLQPVTRANEEEPIATQPPVKIPEQPREQPANDKKERERREPGFGFKPNTIIGRVIDEKGRPIAGAEAFLFRINSNDSSRKLVAKTSTNAEGKYQFENVIDIPKEFPDSKLWPINPLDERFVQVYVRAPGRVAEMQMDMRQQVASKGRVFDMKLLPAATLRGRVTGPDNRPVGSALVSVGVGGYTRWEGVASARTKPDGTYEINDVPAYSMDEYQKKQAEQQRSMESLRSGTYGSSTYVKPPVVSVEHPDFAIKHTTYEKIPGTQDVKLSPAAVIEGRVVFGDSTKPAPGAVVRLESPRSNGSRPTLQHGLSQHFAQTRTDADGKYRFESVPGGDYNLSAELPNYVNVGIDKFAALAGKTSTAPNLFLTAGGVISIRFVDEQTGKPIPITSDTWADISASSFPLNSGISRTAWAPNAVANSAGRFELHALPGKRSILVFHVNEGEKVKWVGKPSTGQLKPHAVVDVAEGKTVEVDIPVVDGQPRVTGTFSRSPIPVAPAKVEPSPESQPKSKPSSDRSPNKKDGVYQKVIIPVVVAKHVLLLGGTRTTTWEEIDAMIGALSDPSDAYPRFYITHGAIESGVDKDAKPHFHELHRKYKLKEHSEGTLAARTSFRYDKIRNQADLAPDQSLRVEGTVVGPDGKPVADAEVVLITPVDASLSYKDYDITIVKGRLRNRLDEVVADTDAAGRFVIYPPKGQKYSLVAFHPQAGFNFARDEQFAASRKLNLVAWASLGTEIAAEAGAKQTASLSTRLPQAAGYPNITISQYSEDFKSDKPAKAFAFTHVPPVFQTTIQRGFAQPDGGTISLPGASVGLLPGEERKLDLGPLSEKQRELLKWQRDESKKRADALRERVKEDQGAAKPIGLQNGGRIQLVQSTAPAAEKKEAKLPPGILGYGDGKPDGKKASAAAAR